PADELLLGLPGAALQGKGRAVRLAFLSDLDELSPFPVIESAVTLHPPGERDLDFTLERGRIDLTNEKKEGAAKVRVHFAKRYWDLTLERPGTRVALEIYSRWPAGHRFDPKAKKDPSPVTSVVLLVLKGQVDRSCPECQHALAAPP